MDHAEKVLDLTLPTADEASEIVKPGEEPLIFQVECLQAIVVDDAAKMNGILHEHGSFLSNVGCSQAPV